MAASSPQRILHVIDSLANGGAERQLGMLASAQDSGGNVAVWCVDDGPFSKVLGEAGVSVQVAGRRSRGDLRPLLRLGAFIGSFRPDVVHTWGWMSSAAATLQCLPRGIPIVDGTIRMGMVGSRGTTVQALGMKCATMVVANSMAGLRAWGLSGVRQRVVRNGIDASRFSTEHASSGRPRPFTICMVGRMVPGKDYSLLLDALEIMATRPGPSVHTLLVGDGPLRNRLAARVRQSAGLKGIELEDPGLDVRGALARSHVGVLLNDPRMHAEGCSNAILEYMAAGMPVVCTDAGGNAEVVIHRKTGILVRPGDVRGLIVALESFRDQPQLKASLGAAGRRRVCCQFTISRMLQAYSLCYAQVLKLPPGALSRTHGC